MVNLTIDGKKIDVPEGTTVLRAAQLSGIEIPTLCDHPTLAPYGGCRLCLVEIDGFRTLQPSCTLPASNGMLVRTDTEKVRTARKFVLTLIFSERNHFCPYCQVSGGDCELQNSAYREGMTHWQLQPNWQPYPVDASHKYIIQENNRCILCRRCVRACAELVGNFTLNFEERGARSSLVADLGNPLGESTCISCGVCVQVCPTGALIDRWSAYRGRETQVEHHPTVCVGCSIGCGIDVLTRDNNLIRIEGNWSATINEGVICKVGRFHPMTEDRQRLLTPLVRKDGVLKAATWDEALKVSANHLKPGKEEVAALASSRLPAEVLYTFKLIFEKLQSRVISSTEEDQVTAVSANLAAELGKPFETDLDALQISDCVFAIGVDLVDDHEVVGFLVKRSLPLGTKLVVVDAEVNPLDALADFTLKTKVTDLDLLLILIAAVKGQPLPPSAAKTGISPETFQALAQMLSAAKKPVVIFGKGITTKSIETLRALLEFAELIGATLLSTKGGANSLAATQYKLDQPFVLDRQKTAFVLAGDEVISQRLIQRLEKAKPFLIVLSSYRSQLTSQADVVLPVFNWLEQDGHYLSMDGHLQEAHKSLQAPDEVHSSIDVLKALASLVSVTLNDDWKDHLTQRVSPVSIVIA
jgi:formate dehydrogenase major subunit